MLCSYVVTSWTAEKIAFLAATFGSKNLVDLCDENARVIVIENGREIENSCFDLSLYILKNQRQ